MRQKYSDSKRGQENPKAVVVGVTCDKFGYSWFFKYYDFFVSEFVVAANWLGWGLNPEDYLLNLLLPVGISFYTFQTMAYSIDIYRGDITKPETILLDLLCSSWLLVQSSEHHIYCRNFSQPFRLSIPMVKEGVFLILLGFIKKVVIADRLAIEPYYESLATHSVDAALCMLLFTCQIYVDFSSYSDIAIGIGLLLGYHIRPNFNLPFVVPSIPERWRRWHLSMSHWFRDYIFIPLGGSRQGTVRTQTIL